MNYNWLPARRLGMAAAVIVGSIGVILLIFEHRLHVAPFVPWLFLLACPLMHLLHHRGHNQPHEGHDVRDANATEQK